MHRLSREGPAVCAVPLCDHFGRVLGVLQASGKLPPSSEGADPDHGLSEWEQDEHDTPAFTQSDTEFLLFVGDRVSAQLQYLDASGKSAAEVLKIEATHSELQEKVGEQLQQLTHSRSEIVHAKHEAFLQQEAQAQAMASMLHEQQQRLDEQVAAHRQKQAAQLQQMQRQMAQMQQQHPPSLRHQQSAPSGVHVRSQQGAANGAPTSAKATSSTTTTNVSPLPPPVAATSAPAALPKLQDPRARARHGGPPSRGAVSFGGATEVGGAATAALAPPRVPGGASGLGARSAGGGAGLGTSASQPVVGLRPPRSKAAAARERQLDKLAAGAMADDPARSLYDARGGGAPLEFTTPEEMFEDLCRQLREL